MRPNSGGLAANAPRPVRSLAADMLSRVAGAPLVEGNAVELLIGSGDTGRARTSDGQHEAQADAGLRVRVGAGRRGARLRASGRGAEQPEDEASAEREARRHGRYFAGAFAGAAGPASNKPKR